MAVQSSMQWHSYLTVVPAKAGTQRLWLRKSHWVPAFAGTTVRGEGRLMQKRDASGMDAVKSPS
jgi:hypothetical protein